MDLNFQDAPATVQSNSRIKPETTGMEAARASYSLSAMDATTQSVADIAEMTTAKSAGGPQLTPDELNQKYPGLDKPFTEPMTEKVAGIIADRARTRKELATQIATGPQGGFYGIANVAAALAPHAIDPINVGSGLLLSAGIGYLARLGEAGLAARNVYQAARIAKMAQMVKNGGYVGTFAEGVAGNLVTEPLTLIAAQQDDRDYSTADFMMNTVGGAALLPGIVHGGKHALKGIKWTGDFAISKSAHFVNRIDPKWGEIMEKSAIARYLSDKRARPDLIVKENVVAIDGNRPAWSDFDYQFSKMDPSTPQNRRLFMATYDRNADIKGSFSEAPTEHVGYGMYATDRPEVANGAASRKTSDPGQIIEVKLNDDFKMLDADQPPAFKLPDVGVETEGKTLTQIMDEAAVKDAGDGGTRLEQLQNSVTSAGYDGVTLARSSAQGYDLKTPHNEVLVYNKDKVSEVTRIDPDGNTRGRLDQSEITKAYDENTDEGAHFLLDDKDRQQLSLFEDEVKTPQKNPKLTELNKMDDLLNEEIQSLQKQDLLDSDDLRQLELVDKAGKEHEAILRAEMEAVICLGVMGV